MRKSAANENWSGARLSAAFALALVALGCPGKVAAVPQGWPRATYYTVITRAGDTIKIIARRYHVPHSLVVKLNGPDHTGWMSPGRVVRIPALTRATREAVLFEAIGRSAPNDVTQASALVVSPSAVPVARAAVKPARADPRPAGRRTVDAGMTQSPRFCPPLAGPIISSFGRGAHGTRNDGINIAASRGAPFRAAADGTVSYAGYLHGYGNLILIAHSHGYVTAYAHADNIAVVRGEAVEQGRVIGTAGTSGEVDRPQLHFEVRRGLAPVDPNLLFGADS